MAKPWSTASTTWTVADQMEENCAAWGDILGADRLTTGFVRLIISFTR